MISGLALLLAATPGMALAQGSDPDVEAILNDPEAPVSGNPKGNVTIVAFLDYNCPFCKKSAPDLARLVREDGQIRLVYKDWPVIAETSVYAAQLALAAAYQGSYAKAHDALMATKGRLGREQIAAAIKGAGVDMAGWRRMLAARQTGSPRCSGAIWRRRTRLGSRARRLI